MQIKSRFLIMIGVLFIVGGTMAVALVNQQMRTHALFEAESKALAALDHNHAISTYFSQQLKPKLFELTDATRSKDYFEPTWMSSTYAKREINKYRKSSVTAGYYYKECAINARSPENEANDYEKEFLEALSKDPKLMVSSGQRILQGKSYFVVLRRGEAMEASCLRCHGNPDQAPGGLVRYYGSERSFHRKVGDVVQAISIRVPLSVAFAEANRLSFHLSVMLLMLFMLLFGVLYWLSRRWVFRPLDHIREKALVISESGEHLGEKIPLPSGRELKELTASFNKMSVKLRENRDHLEEQVKERTQELEIANQELKAEITERKLAEEALRESEEKYRTILESVEDGYFEVDIAGNFTFFNDSLCEMLGYPKDELMGMNNRQYTDEEDAKELYQTFNTVYRTGKPDKGFDWEIIRKDGTRRSVESSVSLRTDAEGEPIGFRGVVRDITEKQRLERQLQQMQKAEAISTLAGGIAHEFNNALMGIMGNIELFKMDLPEDERTDKYFEAMKDSGHRMSRLTDQLLAYSEGGKYEAKNLKLTDFVIETLPILQHDLSPTIRVETHFSKDISYIRADHTQMQMVLSSILTNSNEAIEDEGLIRITAENKNIDEDFAKQHPGLKPGPYVCLTVEDDGKGMGEEEREKIFEPFFTTKFQGRGMGMAAVYGIIKSHDGAIMVESEPGKGTVVRIYLPAIEAKEEVKEEVVLRPTVELATGEGTILVIEDEEPLVELFRQILERLGYRVLQARTGREAVEFAKTFDGQIDLALLDIKLPDMDGGRVYPLIMEARPDLKVIVCSGYSIDGPAQAILDAGAEGFIQKPFLIAPFAEKLKEVLEG